MAVAKQRAQISLPSSSSQELGSAISCHLSSRSAHVAAKVSIFCVSEIRTDGVEPSGRFAARLSAAHNVGARIRTSGPSSGFIPPGTAGTGSGTTGESSRLSPANFSRSEEHTSELQSLTRISYALIFLKKQTYTTTNTTT